MSDQKKNVFITGGSTGIGAASVRKFAQSGWNVTFMDINVEDGQAVPTFWLIEKIFLCYC